MAPTSPSLSPAPARKAFGSSPFASPARSLSSTASTVKASRDEGPKVARLEKTVIRKEGGHTWSLALLDQSEGVSGDHLSCDAGRCGFNLPKSALRDAIVAEAKRCDFAEDAMRGAKRLTSKQIADLRQLFDTYAAQPMRAYPPPEKCNKDKMRRADWERMW